MTSRVMHDLRWLLLAGCLLLTVACETSRSRYAVSTVPLAMVAAFPPPVDRIPGTLRLRIASGDAKLDAELRKQLEAQLGGTFEVLATHDASPAHCELDVEAAATSLHPDEAARMLELLPLPRHRLLDFLDDATLTRESSPSRSLFRLRFLQHCTDDPFGVGIATRPAQTTSLVLDAPEPARRTLVRTPGGTWLVTEAFLAIRLPSHPRRGVEGQAGRDPDSIVNNAEGDPRTRAVVTDSILHALDELLVAGETAVAAATQCAAATAQLQDALETPSGVVLEDQRLQQLWATANDLLATAGELARPDLAPAILSARDQVLRQLFVRLDPSAPRGSEQQHTARLMELLTPTSIAAAANFDIEFVLSLPGRATGAQRLVELLHRSAAPIATQELDRLQLLIEIAAPGCGFTDGSVQQLMVLTNSAAHQQVRFVLQASADAPDEIPVVCRVWQAGRLLATLSRQIAVAAAAAATPQLQSGEATTLFVAKAPRANSDLTILLHTNNGDQTCTVLARDLLPNAMTRKVGAIDGWLHEQLAPLGATTRGRDPDAPTDVARRDQERLLGFGQELWRRLAPENLKSAYADLRARLGDEFDSICIYTDDPSVPWELLVPPGEDGAPPTFLGARHRVGRWHLEHGAQTRARPQRALRLETLAVIAPSYTGTERLPAQDDEVSYLSATPDYLRIDPSVDGLRTLLRKLPAGIVHFAGHGRSQRIGHSATYAMHLQDGEIDPWTWRGMATPGDGASTLFFFNACEMGRVDQAASFVDGWAPTVMEHGSCGCIAPSSPIVDASAAQFAKTFYRLLYERDSEAVPIGELLRQARQELLAQGDVTGLWFAFYGDPDLAVDRRR